MQTPDRLNPWPVGIDPRDSPEQRREQGGTCLGPLLAKAPTTPEPPSQDRLTQKTWMALTPQGSISASWLDYRGCKTDGWCMEAWMEEGKVEGGQREGGWRGDAGGMEGGRWADRATEGMYLGAEGPLSYSLGNCPPRTLPQELEFCLQRGLGLI